MCAQRDEEWDGSVGKWMLTAGERVDPVRDLKMLYFFMITQGFLDQHRHSRAFSLLPFLLKRHDHEL